MAKAKLLQIAPRFSATPTSGGELRIHHMAAGLARHMAVSHLGFSSSSARAVHLNGVEFVPVLRANSYRPSDVLRGALGAIPFPILNYTRRTMRAAVADRLERQPADFILLESIHMAGYLPLLARRSSHIVICDWHNIESELLFRFSENTGGAARKWYARRAAKKTQAFEQQFVHRCDLHITVSARDRDALLRYGVRAPVLLIDNGVDAESLTSSDRPQGAVGKFRVLFVGSMDYHANIEAVMWFAARVWPQIRTLLPEAVFTIAGRNPVPRVRELSAIDGIEVTGLVPDPRPYYREAFAVVAPIHMGGGTRIKILEAMAAGVPVVTTTLGAEGLEASPDMHYILADTDVAQCNAVVALARNPDLGRRLAEAARTLVRLRYDWQALTCRLAEELLAFQVGRAA